MCMLYVYARACVSCSCVLTGWRAVLQEGSTCWCGDGFGEPEDAYPAVAGCDYPCPGDPTLTCGGYLRNAVFVVGGDAPYSFFLSTHRHLWTFSTCDKTYLFLLPEKQPLSISCHLGQPSPHLAAR